MINNVLEIVPHPFMRYCGRQIVETETSFYRLPEERIHSMVVTHYDHEIRGLSGFTSWAASLHLVLCYASSMNKDDQPHVTVIDTHAFREDILVWHCKHLISKGDDEYLVYGPIRGRGYRAIPLDELEGLGLHTLCPELRGDFLQYGLSFQFGCRYRGKMFETEPKEITGRDVMLAERIALCFGILFPPTFMAPLCSVPRPRCVNGERYFCRDCNSDQIKLVHAVIELAPPSSYLQGMSKKDWLWLIEGTVDTDGRPDVEQWIRLFRAVIRYEAPSYTCSLLKVCCERNLKIARPRY